MATFNILTINLKLRTSTSLDWEHTNRDAGTRGKGQLSPAVSVDDWQNFPNKSEVMKRRQRKYIDSAHAHTHTRIRARAHTHARVWKPITLRILAGKWEAGASVEMLVTFCPYPTLSKTAASETWAKRRQQRPPSYARPAT